MSSDTNDRKKHAKSHSGDTSPYGSRTAGHGKGVKLLKKLSRAFNTRALTAASVAAAVIVIAAVAISHQSLMKEYDEKVRLATESAADSVNTKPKEKDVFAVLPDEIIPDMNIPAEDAVDGQGRCIVDVAYSADGALSSATYFAYDDAGAVRTENLYSGGGQLISRVVYPNSSDGAFSPYAKVVIAVEYDKQNRFDGYTASCINDAYVELKKICYSSGGIMEQYAEYEYDEALRVKKESYYSSHETLSSYALYDYDELGNLSVKRQYDDKGVEALREQYYYDGENRLVRDEFYQNSVCRSFGEYEYDDYGNRTKYVSTLVDEENMIYDKRRTDG